uniref:Uncharacterized protein n=1 Tax=Rhizophora mucronata TaxID=61149 RepID=A0A2P2N2K8_RHIMU
MLGQILIGSILRMCFIQLPLEFLFCWSPLRMQFS